MAHQIIWLKAALKDLDDIAAYIGENSPSYARAVVQRMIDASRDLKSFPLMGRSVPEWDKEEIRERIIHSYRLIYRVEPNRVSILSVFHGARLLPDDIQYRSI